MLLIPALVGGLENMQCQRGEHRRRTKQGRLQPLTCNTGEVHFTLVGQVCDQIRTCVQAGEPMDLTFITGPERACEFKPDALGFSYKVSHLN